MQNTGPTYPILKAADWPHRELAVAQRLDVGQEDERLPWIAFGYDLPDQFELITRQELESKGLSREELFRTAIANLREREATWQRLEGESVEALGENSLACLDDDLAAERILDPGFMQQAQDQLNTVGLIAAIPRRGALIVIPLDAPQQFILNLVLNTAQQFQGEKSAPITPLNFLLQDGNLVGMLGVKPG